MPEARPDVALRPVTDDELADARVALLEGYRDGMVAHAGLSAERAAAKAATDMPGLFPEGRPADGLDVLVVEEDGAARGYALLGERATESGRVAFVYAIELDEAHRGRGLGRAAMTLLEERARARGLDRVELNVFGGNDVARGLYRSLGYEEVAVYMGKAL